MTELEQNHLTEAWLNLWRDGQPHTFLEIRQIFPGHTPIAVMDALNQAILRRDLGFDHNEGTYYATRRYLKALGVEAPFTRKSLIFPGCCEKHSPTLHRVIAWLRAVLQEPCWAEDVQALAQEAGISFATLRRAKQTIGVVSIKKGGHFGGDPRWQWQLSEDEYD
jgi:hypothetical protein